MLLCIVSDEIIPAYEHHTANGRFAICCVLFFDVCAFVLSVTPYTLKYVSIFDSSTMRKKSGYLVLLALN